MVNNMLSKQYKEKVIINCTAYNIIDKQNLCAVSSGVAAIGANGVIRSGDAKTVESIESVGAIFV